MNGAHASYNFKAKTMKNEQVKSDYQTILTVKRHNESGFALVAALIILLLLGVISATVLAFSTTETRVATNEIKRNETFYAAEAKLEEMTNRFNNLFQSSVQPPQSVLDNIANTNSANLNSVIVSRGYSFSGSALGIDTDEVAALQAIFGTTTPFIRIPDGPYYGMSATVTPYIGLATATDTYSGTTVQLKRKFNSYLLPVFQFSLFSDGDIELDPGKAMFVSGRVHANKNVYALRNLLFTGNITAAGELVRDVNRGGGPNNKTDFIGVSMMVKSPSSVCTNQVCQVPFYNGATRYESVTNGPSFSGTVDTRGYHPGSPAGSPILTWDTDSLMAPDRAGPDVGTTTPGDPGHFNNQVLTTSSNGLGIEPLTLPLGLDNVKPVELIKRSLPSVDTSLISDARYDNKAQIRILIDDEDILTANDAGITGVVNTVGGGVKLSGFVPIRLNSGNCTSLRIFDNTGNCNYVDYGPPIQKDPVNGNAIAETVRGVKNTGTDLSPNGRVIPHGSGIKGRIKIEVVNTSGVVSDVTTEILSMGMTVGEPNAIVRLQRPLWAAFMQDSFDRNASQTPWSPTLYNLQNGNNGMAGQDGLSGQQQVVGEIRPLQFADMDTSVAGGYIKTRLDNLTNPANGNSYNTVPKRSAAPPSVPATVDLTLGADLNAIVPINVYNVREGWINNSQSEYRVYRRGVTSVVDINMRNLVRWLDGKFDNNLLAGKPNAQSSNIGSNKGYVVYVSDRRGDIVRNETTNLALQAQGKPASLPTTNGNVDNEDVYFNPAITPPTPNSTLDNGEDVITDSVFVNNTGALQKDSPVAVELPDFLMSQPATWDPWGLPGTPPSVDDRYTRALQVMSWHNDGSVLPAENYFRRSVRLSNGENLTTTCSYGGATGTPPIAIWNCTANKLNATKGITIASENMVYVAGNYNTNGIGVFTTGGSNLNSGKLSDYLGPQVPSSIICDAFFPLSKTWFDANAAMYPEGNAGGRVFSYPIYRKADEGSMSTSQETAVRTAVMFGSTLSALNNPGGAARDANGTISSGGMHSAPRFLELWNGGGVERHWSFTGSMVTLFNSTQAFAPWESGVTYTPPVRNWSYDSTFNNPDRLPPGTPFFQYVQSSGFEQVINQ